MTQNNCDSSRASATTWEDSQEDGRVSGGVRSPEGRVVRHEESDPLLPLEAASQAQSVLPVQGRVGEEELLVLRTQADQR